MPHFVIDCPERVLAIQAPAEILRVVNDVAQASGLFKDGDVKVRIRPFDHYVVGGAQSDFIHVFGYIMEGRNTDQKANLSRAIIGKLKSMFPDVPVISMNISEFDRPTYSNRNSI